MAEAHAFPTALTERAIWCAGVFVIVAGLGESLFRLARSWVRNRPQSGVEEARALAACRVVLSSWLSLGLTVFLAEEVLRTFRVTTWTQIGRLVAVAVFRQLIVWALDNDVRRLRADVSFLGPLAPSKGDSDTF